MWGDSGGSSRTGRPAKRAHPEGAHVAPPDGSWAVKPRAQSVRRPCGGAPSEVVPSATVRQATAARGEMPRLASTSSAAAGPRKATVWMRLRTAVTGTPRRTSPSASSPAAELPTAITCGRAARGCLRWP